MKTIITLFILALTMTSCYYNAMDKSGKYQIYQRTDDFSPDTIDYFSTLVLIKGGFAAPRLEIEFHYKLNKRTNELSHYYISAWYMHDSWMFVKSIIAKSADSIYTYSGPYENGVREVIGGLVSERVAYIIPSKDMDTFYIYKQLKLRIMGDKYYLEKELSESDIDKLTQFVDFIDDKIIEEPNNKP